MKTLWTFVATLVWSFILGIAGVVVVWFTVSLIRVCWQLPFGGHAGQISGLVRGIMSDPLPDAVGWLLIASFAVVSIGLNRARDHFITDLAVAIGKHMPSPSDYVQDVHIVEDDSEVNS